MPANREIRRTAFSAAICTLLTSLIFTVPCHAALTLGHQVILEKGLQLKTLAMPSRVSGDGGTFDVDLYKTSGFNTIDLFNLGYTYDYYVANNNLPGGSNALNFSRMVTSTTAALCSATYVPNIVSIQLGDEQPIDAPALPLLTTQVAALKARLPNAIVYTNQSALYNEDSNGNNLALTSTLLNNYVQAVKPDMLSFTEYPFRWQGTNYYNYYGGSPTWMYQHIELYRKAGLAGLTGDGSQPIPVSMFAQTFTATTNASTNHREPTESEFRLQQFAGWAAGMKSVETFLYENLQPEGLDSMFFEGTSTANQTPTTQFYQYKELNRQSAHLGPALTRLISTDFRMKMGSHGTTPVTNTLPTGVSTFDTTADPYLTGITATNLGTCNNGLPGDVIYGAFKPLDASLVAEGCENDVYFMIVNGLTDGDATTAAECSQRIHLTFDFGGSGISSLLRKSRETGAIEEVELTHVGGSIYSLDLTLDGGTGDLFKYNTGSTFVPEPASYVSTLAGILSWFVWRKRRAMGRVHN